MDSTGIPMSVDEGISRRKTFALGVVTGLGISIAVVLGLSAFIVIRGVTITMDSRSIAYMVKEKVEKESRLELPLVMKRLAADAPGAISGKLRSSKGISVRLMDTDIHLPASVSRDLDARIEERLAKALSRAAEEYDVDPLVRIVGRSAYRMVNDSLYNEIRGKRFPLRIYPWLTIPVIIGVD